MVERSSDDRARGGDDKRWTGYYTYGTGEQAGEKHSMDLVLVMDDGQIRGRGSDVEVGAFEIDGAYRPGANEVEFLKRYPARNDIRYTGFFEEGYGIWGVWKCLRSGSLVRLRVRGEFRIWPVDSDERHGEEQKGECQWQ